MSLDQGNPRGRARKPPLAPASVYAPLGRRRYWWYAYRCRTCGAHQFGRAKSLDAVTGVRRASCGHQVSVMAARIYTSPEAA
jgi:DNA-directed RNA polymerase subunit RPC12/RpoP